MGGHRDQKKQEGGRKPWVPACLPACLPARVPTCLPACPHAHLPACPPACLPAHLPACLPARPCLPHPRVQRLPSPLSQALGPLAALCLCRSANEQRACSPGLTAGISADLWCAPASIGRRPCRPRRPAPPLLRPAPRWWALPRGSARAPTRAALESCGGQRRKREWQGGDPFLAVVSPSLRRSPALPPPPCCSCCSASQRGSAEPCCRPALHAGAATRRHTRRRLPRLPSPRPRRTAHRSPAHGALRLGAHSLVEIVAHVHLAGGKAECNGERTGVDKRGREAEAASRLPSHIQSLTSTGFVLPQHPPAAPTTTLGSAPQAPTQLSQMRGAVR